MESWFELIAGRLVNEPLVWSYLLAAYVLLFTQKRSRLLFAGLTLLILPGYIMMALLTLQEEFWVYDLMMLLPFLRILGLILVAVAIFHRIGVGRSAEPVREQSPASSVLQRAAERQSQNDRMLTEEAYNMMMKTEPGLRETDSASGNTDGEDGGASWKNLSRKASSQSAYSAAASRGTHSVFDERLAAAREKAAAEKAAREKRRKGGRFDV